MCAFRPGVRGCWVALLTPLVAVATCDSPGTEPIPPQPNFIVILTDELDPRSMS
jgi:hypothetical protein